MDGNIRLDPTFQGYFNSLKSENGPKRIESSEHLLNFLTKLEKNECIQYSLTRLVRGLSSNKQQARVGFATALTGILRQFKQIKIEQVNAVVQETLKPDSKKDTRKEYSEKLLGQLLVYMSIIQSERIKEASSKELCDIVRKLRWIATKKKPLGNLVTQVLNQLIFEVSHDQFRSVVLEELKDELTKGWEECDGNRLSLLLNARKAHKDVVDSKFLKQYWGSKKVMSEGTITKLAAVIEGTVVGHPLVHKVCEQLIMYEHKRVDVLWQQVYESVLLVPDARRSFLLMSLVPFALQHCTSAEQIRCVLSPRLVAMVIKQGLAGKDAILAAATKKLCQELVSFCEGCENAELQVAVVTSLVSTEGMLQFDQKDKQNTITKIISTLTADGAKQFAQYAIDIITGKTKIEYLPSDSPAGQRWACQYLPLCLCRMPGNTDDQLHVMRFLLLHAYFSRSGTKEGLMHCDSASPTFERSASVQQLIRQTYQKALSKVAVAGKAERTKSKKHFIEVLYQLVQYTQSLLTSGVVTADSKWEDDVKQSWTQALEFIEIVRSAEQKKSTEAFQLLLLHLGLHLLEDPESTVDSLVDVQVCYVKAHKDENKSPRKKKQKVAAEDDEGEEPAWMEVLTELLLSFLARESSLLRTVVSSVFRMLNDSLTPGTMTLLIKAVQSLGEEDNLAFEDSEEMMMEGGEEDCEDREEEESSDEESEESEESDSEDSDDSEEENITVIEDLKKSLKAALGKAGVESKDDEEEEDSQSDDELGDDEMFKLDGQLAAVFRALKMGKKDDPKKTIQFVNFKIRVLNLLVELDTALVAPSLVLPLLRPLVEIIESALQEKCEELERKAVMAYNTLCKIKANPSQPVSVDDTMEKLQELVDLSKKVFTMQNIQRIAAGCLCMIRVVLGTAGLTVTDMLKDPKAKGVTEKVLGLLKELLSRFSQEQGKMSMLLITMVQRQPELLWPLLDDMLAMAGNEKTRVFAKSKLLEIMTSMVNKRMMSVVGKEAMDAVIPKVSGLSKKLMMWQAGLEQPNNKLVSDTLALTCQTALLCDGDAMKMHFNLSAELGTIRAKISQDAKKQCNRLASLLQNKCGLKVEFKAGKPQAQKKKASGSADEEPPAKKVRAVEEEEDTSEEEQMEVEETEETKDVKKDGQKPGLASKKRRKRVQQKRKKAQQMDIELTNGTESSTDTPKKKKDKKKKKSVANEDEV